MATVAVEVCQVKRGLFGRCQARAAGVCVYCGSHFCSEHGVFLEDGQEVCGRKPCVAKREDLDRHLLYKQGVNVRNEAGRCGIEACTGVISTQCARCKGLFCGRHADAREEPVMESMVRIYRPATLCHHCWKRRPIWLRT